MPKGLQNAFGKKYSTCNPGTGWCGYSYSSFHHIRYGGVIQSLLLSYLVHVYLHFGNGNKLLFKNDIKYKVILSTKHFNGSTKLQMVQ